MQNSSDLPFPFEIHDQSILLALPEAQTICSKLSNAVFADRRLYPLVTSLRRGLSAEPSDHVPLDITHAPLLTNYYAKESRRDDQEEQVQKLHLRCASALLGVCLFHGLLPPED